MKNGILLSIATVEEHPTLRIKSSCGEVCCNANAADTSDRSEATNIAYNVRLLIGSRKSCTSSVKAIASLMGFLRADIVAKSRISVVIGIIALLIVPQLKLAAQTRRTTSKAGPPEVLLAADDLRTGKYEDAYQLLTHAIKQGSFPSAAIDTILQQELDQKPANPARIAVMFRVSHATDSNVDPASPLAEERSFVAGVYDTTLNVWLDGHPTRGLCLIGIASQ